MILRNDSHLTAYPLSLIIVCLSIACSVQDSNTNQKAPAQTARIEAVAEAVGNRVYFIGGITADMEVTDLVEVYDPREDKWSNGVPMLTARGGAASIATDKYIYVLGGRRYGDILGTVERYDPTTDSWTELSPMPTARWLLMAAVIGDKIYAVGGISGTGNARRALDVAEVYDPASDTWTQASPMPVARSNASVAVVDGKLYIISGRLGVGRSRSTTRGVAVYDPAEDSWVRASPITNARTGSEACVVDGMIYIVGGASGGDVTNNVEVYDPQTWRSAGNLALAVPRSAHCCAAIGKSIYIMGGARRPDFSSLLTSVEELALSSVGRGE